MQIRRRQHERHDRAAAFQLDDAILNLRTNELEVGSWVLKTQGDAGLVIKMDEVLARGDAARGEQVFRRSDTSCFQCHAIGGAGGQLAPDLRAIGASSPMDYLIDSDAATNPRGLLRNWVSMTRLRSSLRRRLRSALPFVRRLSTCSFPFTARRRVI